MGGESTSAELILDRRVVMWALALPIAVIGAGHFVVNVLMHWNFSAADLDSELSVGTWYSTLQLGLAATLALVAGVTSRSKAERLPWLGVAALALACSADEVLGLHERLSIRLEEALDLGPPFSFGLPLIAAALAPLVVVTAVWAYRALPRPAGGFVAAGALVYLLAAGGFEQLESWASDKSWSGVRGNWSGAFRSFIGLEEVIELVAIALILWGAFVALPARVLLRLPGVQESKGAWRS